MAFPPISLIIEAAFGYAPLGARVWTDITDAVRSLKCSRGKNQWLASAQPGSATFKLNNRDRRFDPSNTTGPFNPNLKVRVPIRVRAVYNAVTYPVWMGFAHKIHPEWPDGVNSDTIIEAAGIFDFLSGLRGSLPNSPWELAVRQTPNKRSWWRLGETVGSEFAIDQIGPYHLTYVGPPTLEQVSLITADADTSVLFGGAGFPVARASDTNVALIGDYTIVAWFKRNGVPAGAEYIVMQGDTLNSYIQVYMGLAGEILYFVKNADGNSQITGVIPGTPGFADNLPHMVMVKKAGVNISVSVDDGAVATVALATATGVSPGSFRIGRAFFDQPFIGTIDEVATWDRALTAAEITALYQGGLAWAGDTTGVRMNRIFDYIGITAADRSVDAGNTTLQIEESLGTDVFSKLEEYRHAENGELFEAADGKATFHSRQHRMVSPFNVSQATFSNLNTATNPIKSGGVSAPLDDHQDFFNDVPVSRKHGISYRATDPAAGDTGLSTLTGFEDLPIASDLEVVDAATFLLNRYKTPRQRVDELHIDPFAKPDNLFPQVLGREIGDRITVAHQPAGGGPSFTTDQVIEGVDHEISVEGGLKWETVFRTNFAETAFYLVFDDAVSGRVDFGMFAY